MLLRFLLMESYLTGRGDSSLAEGLKQEDDQFRSYLQDDPKQVQSQGTVPQDGQEEQVEVIYDQANAPKVEVVSTDGRPSRIVVHLPDGKLLEISCQY